MQAIELTDGVTVPGAESLMEFGVAEQTGLATKRSNPDAPRSNPYTEFEDRGTDAATRSLVAMCPEFDRRIVEETLRTLAGYYVWYTIGAQVEHDESGDYVGVSLYFIQWRGAREYGFRLKMSPADLRTLRFRANRRKLADVAAAAFENLPK